MNTSIRPGSIVVAVDGSEHAERAVAWAAEQARLERRELALVTATEIWGPDHSGPDRILADAAHLAEELAPGIELKTLTLVGDPRGVLFDLSRDAHLLVMGSRGRGTVRSMLLGSVTATVSKIAECPIVVCRPRRHTTTGRGVVVGCDGTPGSLTVLEFAFAQASLRDLPLTVVHCVWDVVAAVAGLRNVSIEDLDQSVLEDEQRALAESVAGFAQKYPDVSVNRRIAHGLVDEVLAGRTAQWDLVVVGRHSMDTIGRMVSGSISTAVIERAHTTVAVVPEPGERQDRP